MAGYKPINIKGYTTGLVQSREEFLLPYDAYPTLYNAYVWREKIIRKRGCQALGRLQRNLVRQSISTISALAPGDVTVSLFPRLPLSASETTPTFVAGTVANPITITIGGSIAQTLTDTTGKGTLTVTPAGNITFAFLNYSTGSLRMTFSSSASSSLARFTGSYNPNLPVMGICVQEQPDSANDQTIFFDQVYAYVYNSVNTAFQEFIPGTTWNASGAPVTATNFFWPTNYWVSQLYIPGTTTPLFTTSNVKLFWATNNSGASSAAADPIRVTDGTTWVDFSPANGMGQIDSTNYMTGALMLQPFRGRLLALNTYEGPSYSSAINYRNRIRWSTIGNPFIPYSAGPPATGAWRDDIRGQGGYLDIPVSEDIVSSGFVRDNLVIYCERSTWQLRYTGRSIAPFQIEKVNSELGAEGTFSAVQFDTSLVGIGDKGVVECDSYKSERIDVKIPDLVYNFTPTNSGVERVHGIRDFVNRLAYWTYTDAASNNVFPTNRLLYNYENDSWSIFRDSYTALGNYQEQSGHTWINTLDPWIDINWTWQDPSYGVPSIVGGNQQGFVLILDVSELVINDNSLYISNITGGNTGNPLTSVPTQVYSPNHNLQTGYIITISNIPTGSHFANLNGGTYSVFVIDDSNFSLYIYNPSSGIFNTPQLNTPLATNYVGLGLIAISDNFSVISKKFNFMDEGQSIQLGYIDILMDGTYAPNPGNMSMYIYLDYGSEISNTIPQNVRNPGQTPSLPDNFFNSTIPTTISQNSQINGTKFWHRVYCATRASFLTVEYTFSNYQMTSIDHTLNIQIDAQIMWVRKGGRLLT